MFIVPPGSGRRYVPVPVHASAAVRIVPSPPSTTSSRSLWVAASAKDRSTWSACPHQVFQLVTPARLRMPSISASDPESQPPLEVLIIAPTFSSEMSRAASFMSGVSQHCCALAGQQMRFLPPRRRELVRARRCSVNKLSLRGSKIEPRRDPPQ